MKSIKSMLKALLTKLDQRLPVMEAVAKRCCLRQPFHRLRKDIHGKHNVLHYGNSILSSVLVDIKGDRNRIEIEDGCLLNRVTFFIRGDDHRIEIKKGCRFSGGGALWLCDRNCSLVIGENSTFEDVHIAASEPGSKVEIGEDCMFAYDIDIRTGDSHSILDSRTGERVNPARDVYIGKHVWVAAHTILLKGVSIPDDCVVATGSVVTRSCDERGVVLAGNPARTVKRQITWSRKRI
jgi:acetyltransferase-like isoleucine patch superfamily enzyme